MTADLGRGTPLICVDATPAGDSWVLPLTKGGLYTCMAVTRSALGPCPRDHCGWMGIELHEKQAPQRVKHNLYCPNRFKPLGGDPDEALRSEPDWTLLTLEDMADRILWPAKPEPVMGVSIRVRLPPGFGISAAPAIRRLHWYRYSG